MLAEWSISGPIMDRSCLARAVSGSPLLDVQMRRAAMRAAGSPSGFAPFREEHIGRLSVGARFPSRKARARSKRWDSNRIRLHPDLLQGAHRPALALTTDGKERRLWENRCRRSPNLPARRRETCAFGACARGTDQLPSPIVHHVLYHPVGRSRTMGMDPPTAPRPGYSS